MKPQDILFILILIILIFKKKPKWLVIAGLTCLLIAIPLFATWTFFTAERLTWYSAGFFLIAIVFSILEAKNER